MQFLARDDVKTDDFKRRNVPWFVLDTNKEVILPSDSGSLLHDIPSEWCAYVYCAIEPGNQGLVFNSVHSVNFYTCSDIIRVNAKEAKTWARWKLNFSFGSFSLGKTFKKVYYVCNFFFFFIFSTFIFNLDKQRKVLFYS